VATNERERAFVVDFDGLGIGGTFSEIVFLFLNSAAEGFLDNLLVGLLVKVKPAVGNLDIFDFLRGLEKRERKEREREREKERKKRVF
jgi:hypothetical protein